MSERLTYQYQVYYEGERDEKIYCSSFSVLESAITQAEMYAENTPGRRFFVTSYHNVRGLDVDHVLASAYTEERPPVPIDQTARDNTVIMLDSVIDQATQAQALIKQGHWRASTTHVQAIRRELMIVNQAAERWAYAR